MTKKCEKCGFRHKSYKVERTYDELMRKAALRKEILFEINYLKTRNLELEFKIQVYDSTYSDADEFPFSKEELQNEFEHNFEQISSLEEELKQLERM